MMYESKFAVGDVVCVDGTRDISGPVTRLQFSSVSTLACVEWFHNGEPKTGWFEEWRLDIHPVFSYNLVTYKKQQEAMDT